MAIKAVIFDLSGVFFKLPEQHAEEIRENRGVSYQFVKEFGAEPDEKNVNKFRNLLKRIFIGEIVEKEALEEYSKFTGLPLPKNPNFWFIGFQVVRDEKVFEISDRLRKNHNVSILTNMIPCHYARLEPHLNAFKPNIYISYEMGCEKPDKEAFDHALKSMKLKPEETIFVDDAKENTEAAEKLGIHSILFKNANQLEKDLKSLGLDF